MDKFITPNMPGSIPAPSGGGFPDWIVSMNGGGLDVDSRFNDLGSAQANINLKMVQKVSNTEYRVFSRKRSKAGYTAIRFRKDAGAASDTANYGSSWGLLRLDQVMDISQATVFNTPDSFTTSNVNSGGNDFQKVALATGSTYTNGGLVYYISNTSRNAVSEWFEFPVNIKKSNFGYLYLGFYSTGASATVVNVYIGGVKVQSLNLSRAAAQFTTFAIPTNGYIGNTTMRIEVDPSSTNNLVHFVGYNFMELDELIDGIDVNNLLFKESNNHYITGSTGANEYAIMEKVTGKWCGSYHGGENSESLLINLDGVDLTAKTNGSFVSGKSFNILQKTDIIGRIKSTILTDITNDSTYNINVRFDVYSSFIANNFYICMTCTNTSFMNIIYPISAVSDSSNTEINVANLGRIIQMNPITNQTITTIYTPFLEYNSNTPLYVQYSTFYAKVYHGLAKYMDFIMSDINFGNTKIFD